MGLQIAQRDKEAFDKLPKVMRDSIISSVKKGTRQFSTSSRQAMDLGLVDAPAPPLEVPGAKFGLPSLPLPPHSHFRFRYDAVVNQVTNLLMRHGRKSVAQRVSRISLRS